MQSELRRKIVAMSNVHLNHAHEVALCKCTLSKRARCAPPTELQCPPQIDFNVG